MRHASTATDLRFAVEQCLRHRHVQTLLIDEAHSLTAVPRAPKLLDQMDNIKSLANLTNVTHVLAATYEGLALIQLSDQLCRRITVIEFPRYIVMREKQEEIEYFQDALFTFQQILPLKEPPDLLKEWEYLFVNSLGCIGTLKGWLERALGPALEHNGGKLTRKHLEQKAIPSQNLSKMLEAIRKGEARMAELHAVSQAHLRALLGFVDRSADQVSLSPPIDAASGRSEAASTTPRRPGTRKPSRDTIGVL